MLESGFQWSDFASRLATTAVVLAILTGCTVNNYEAHYSGTTAQSPDVAGRVLSAVEPPRVSRGSNPEQERLTMLEEGYLLLGSSSFTGPVPSQKALLKQARSVGASRVILYERYQQTVSGKTSLTLPGPATAAAGGGGSGGAEGSVGYHGGETPTTQGTSAVREIPYSVKQYAQLATFWVRARPPRVGIYYRSLNERERGALQRSGGVVVVAVVTGSPAEKAHILRGDVILRANAADVEDPQQFSSILQGAPGPIALEILRGSELQQVTVVPLAQQ